jgi:predicted amidohydrolase
MFSEMSDLGAKLIFLPAAFNMTTGPAHWELLCRSRALDNQIYFAANGQGRDLASPFVAYGHSMVVNPWGEICGKLDHSEAVLTSSVSFEYLENVRGELPIREG